MNRRVVSCVLLMLWILAAPEGAGAGDPPPRLEMDGPRDNLVAFTLRGVKDLTEPIVKIGGARVGIVPGSLKIRSDGAEYFEAELPPGIKPGRIPVEVAVGGDLVLSEPFLLITDPMVAAGAQPLIDQVEPVGGLPSATIKVYGRNFGDMLTRVYLTVGPVSTKVLPISVSQPDERGSQELVFAIPSDTRDGRPNPDFQQILDRSSICNYALLSLTVSGRAANWVTLNVVHPHGLWKVAGLSAALVFLLLSPLLAVCCSRLAVGFAVFLGAFLLMTLHTDLCWIFVVIFLFLAFAALRLSWARRANLRPVVRTLFVDADTGTYSLSKVQAFAWTVVIVGSYFYFAIGRGILVGRAEMPSLSPGLLGLLSISYGGLLVSRGISRRKPKNDFAPTAPRWTNLITEGNSVSITRLQLIGFTIAAIAVYIFYVSGNEVFFRGMPDIPPTINGLLAVSQGGYLGGKIVADTAINYIIPPRARAGETLSIFGVGFLDKTKVLIQGVREAIDAEFVNGNCLKVKLPAEMVDPGPKQIVFIPPTGASFPVSEAFELIAPRILDLDVPSARQVSFALSGIELEPGELRASVGEQPLRVIRMEGSRFTIESEHDLGPGSILDLVTADGEPIGSAELPRLLASSEAGSLREKS